MTDIKHINEKKERKILFETQLNWLTDKKGILTAYDVKDIIRVGLPRKFGGQGEEWSPEHLLLNALSSCFMTTYLDLSDKIGFDISHFECRTIGQIEMLAGKLEFTSINLYPKIFLANDTDRDKATVCLQKTQAYCLVSNSLKSQVIYHTEIFKDKHPLPVVETHNIY